MKRATNKHTKPKSTRALRVLKAGPLIKPLLAEIPTTPFLTGEAFLADAPRRMAALKKEEARYERKARAAKKRDSGIRLSVAQLDEIKKVLTDVAITAQSIVQLGFLADGRMGHDDEGEAATTAIRNNGKIIALKTDMLIALVGDR